MTSPLDDSANTIVPCSTSCGTKRRQLENKSDFMVSLPGDVVDLILYKLDLAGFHCFGEVCRSWQSIAVSAKKRQILQLQDPWLMFSSSGTRLPKIFSLSDGKLLRPKFFSLSLGKLLRPKLLAARGVRCCGSSWGWLIMADHRWGNKFLEPFTDISLQPFTNIFLLNPFTGIQFQLPKEYTFRGLHKLRTPMPHPDCIRKALLLSPPTIATATTSSSNLNDHNDPMVQTMKADYCVAVVITSDCYLFFCRLSDEAWTAFLWGPRCEDIISYQGQLYVISPEFELLHVELGPYQKFTSCGIAPPEGEVDGDFSDKKAVYLVECLGELLMVIRRWDLVCSDPGPDGFCKCQSNHLHLPKTNVLKIFKLDPKGLCWTPLENLGNQMLFLGASGGISLSALYYPSFRGNSIYFTQQNFCMSTPVETVPHACNDTGVFHLEDKSFKSLFLDDGVSPLSPPVWFTPTPLLRWC